MGGWVYGGGGWLGGGPHTRAHARACMHVHAHTCVHGKHDNFMQMAAPIGGIPGNSLWCHMRVDVRARVCVCVHVHVCVGHPLTTPHPHPPTSPPPRGDTPGINQNSIVLELIEIIQFRLKIWNLWRLPHPWVGVWFGGWVGGWVGWWVGSGQNTKNLKIVDWIKIIQSCLKIYHLLRHPHPWVGVWVVGWVSGSMGGSVCQWVGLGQMTNNWVNLDLIEIIQFCLKIYDM